MMKKSQILAALALAFALGVVAPVAGASALTLEEKNAEGTITQHGKATCAEARTAVRFVEEESSFKNILAFYNAAKKAYDIKGDAYFDDPTETDFSVVDINNVEIQAMLSSFGSQLNTAYGVGNLPTAIQDALDAVYNGTTGAFHDLTLSNVEAFLSAIKNDATYKVYEGLYNAIEGNGNFVSAVAAYNNMYRGTNLADDKDNLDAFRDNGTIRGGKASVATDYTNFKALIENIDRATTEINGYKQAKNLIINAYNVLNNNEQILTAGKNAFKTAVTDKETSKDWIVLSDIVSIVLDTNNSDLDDDNYYETHTTGGVVYGALTTNVPNIQDGTGWNGVVTKIGKVMTCTKYTAEDVVFYDLKDLAEDYRGTLSQSISTNDLIKKMVNYDPKTPVEVPTEDPSKNDVNAPASGILGSAEGSATTISIVAGLTTALTALGAGVVAYRNARREK